MYTLFCTVITYADGSISVHGPFEEKDTAEKFGTETTSAHEGSSAQVSVFTPAWLHHGHMRECPLCGDFH